MRSRRAPRPPSPPPNGTSPPSADPGSHRTDRAPPAVADGGARSLRCLGGAGPAVVRRDAEALLFAGSGRHLTDGGDRADHLLLGRLRDFLQLLQPLQVGGG